MACDLGFCCVMDMVVPSCRDRFTENKIGNKCLPRGDVKVVG